ncbi:MAG: hypothetical protein MJ091_06420 [Clostridia bacterium]|nr:hypothetical protein [Clostridia bacterium]
MLKIKNRIIKIVAALVSFILIITFNAAALNKLWSFIGSFQKAVVAYADAPAEDYIYFDINAGSVSISNGTYSGYVFVNGTAKAVTGTHSAENRYYIYQSTSSNKNSSGYATHADFDNKEN